MQRLAEFEESKENCDPDSPRNPQSLSPFQTKEVATGDAEEPKDAYSRAPDFTSAVDGMKLELYLESTHRLELIM